ncbi:PREDICTED: REM2- and Rab-like small GTPase 1 isoform X1 [Chinchilla lanigera]|uniref:REM2- and Rab-like small GTPase 1 isoform X1 n=1 Tax=Chinchilla lanigera TaxID=34839 RepID=UPI0006981342|nr:PREDICTED: REM2- and Rab-like small GTPase 1 isoform X1 [Chinchilla lanigera]
MARPAHGSVIVPDWHETAEGKEYLACILRKNRRRVFEPGMRKQLKPCPQLLTPEILVTETSLGGGPSAGHWTQRRHFTSQQHCRGPALGCLSGHCCLRLWPLTRPATRSLCLGRVAWGRQRWWPSWLDWRCPRCTTRPLASRPLWCSGQPSCRPATGSSCSALSSGTAGSLHSKSLTTCCRFDQYMHTDVPERDLTTFRQAWELPLLRVKSVPGRRLADGRTLDGRAGLVDVAHVLNGLAEQLWHQDQVAAGLLPTPTEKTPG